MSAPQQAGTFHDHFSGFATKYAGFRPHYPSSLFDYLAMVVPTSSHVWDCACGNGQATLDLAERFARVVATDGSQEQLAAATPHPKVEYRVALAEQSGLEDHSVGLVTVAQALHWFDFDRFYAEAKRVLSPGGVFAAWAYGIDQVEGEAANEIAQDYYSNVVGPYWPPERRLVEEGYRTIPFPFSEIVPPVFLMETHWTLEQLLGYFSSWSATNRFIRAKGYNPLEPLSTALSKVWPDPSSTRRITWPLAVRIGRRES